MKMPFIVKNDLTKEEQQLWKMFYKSPKSAFNRAVEEGLWRRTQQPENATQSKWKSTDDARRRIVHYEHCFEAIPNSRGSKDLALVGTYLWIHYTFPASEIDQYKLKLNSLLKARGWQKDETDSSKFKKGDISIQLKQKNEEERDLIEGRKIPNQYSVIEICVMNEGHGKSPDFKEKPWSVLKTGMRKKDKRQSPTTLNARDEIVKNLPAQVELGCGASIEAGIPPLHFLHEVYFVTNQKTGDFILNLDEDDLIGSIITDTEAAYEQFTEMYKKCFEAKPTDFHRLLKKMHDAGYIVGPVITNNFDGLAEKSGLKEIYVRKYEEDHIVPHIDFDPKAKSLLVVGAHADRRKIEQAARKQGLKLLFIDPEGYHNLDGSFTSYPLEGPKNEDILYREGAKKGLAEIAKKLDLENNNQRHQKRPKKSIQGNKRSCPKR